MSSQKENNTPNVTPESPWKIKPGHFGVGPENIHVIENFIELDDLHKIQQFCPTISEWNNEAESVTQKMELVFMMRITGMTGNAAAKFF